MNYRHMFFAGVFLVALFTAPSGWTQPKPETKRPIITSAFAVEKGYYGYIWKIYVEAEDPDEDMLRIGFSGQWARLRSLPNRLDLS